MADTILVVVEQREGKLNRVSWETIAAGQAISAATGWPLEAAMVGANALATEVAAKKVAKVYSVESPRLAPYTPDAFAIALDQTGVENEMIVYPNAPHSFFDRHQAQYAEQSADAWLRIQAFIKDHIPS